MSKNSISLKCILLFLMLCTGLLPAGDNQRCSMCGMKLSKYAHTVYTIIWTDKSEQKTCGVQCGLSLQIMNPEKFKSARARDLLNNHEFDAAKGYYVYKSSVITDMAPGFIAFEKVDHAEKFQKGFGGKVVTFDEALKIWRKVRATRK